VLTTLISVWAKPQSENLMTAIPDAALCVDEVSTPALFSVFKVDDKLRVPTQHRLASLVCLERLRTRFVCSLVMFSLMTFTSNAFGEMMSGRRLVSSSGSSDSGSSSGGRDESPYDSAPASEGTVHFNFAPFVSPHQNIAKALSPSHATNQLQTTSTRSPLNWGFSLLKDLFSRASILSSNKFTTPQAAPKPSNGPHYGSNAGHDHENAVLSWNSHTSFEWNLPHFTESFHAANHFEITKDNHGIDLNWSHHGSFSFEINTPSFHEEFCFSDCFDLNLHWQPGVGLSFSEHLAFNSHFDLQIGHFNWERDRHHDFCFGWGCHPSHHHGGGCHQPPDPPLPSTVPEPTSMALFGLGGIGLIAGLARRRRPEHDQEAAR
jgi:hypothetical protein